MSPWVLVVINTFILLSKANYYCYLRFDSSCYGNAMVAASYAYGYGYKSMFGTTTSMSGGNNQISCDGAFSCDQISFINTSIKTRCFGSNSCSNIDTVTIDGTNKFSNSLRCTGANSCRYSKLRVETEVQCKADQSCAYTNIQQTSSIFANSAYSLYNAVIDSTGSPGNVLNITLSGYYAGFGAQITCQSTDICNINCYGNACYMLYINCVNNNCNINKNSIYTSDPITNINLFNNTGFSLLFDEQHTVNNDQLCENNVLSSYIYDDYQEHYNGSDISINVDNNGPICCRGAESCQETLNIEINTNPKESVICSGNRACQGIDGGGHTISNSNGPVFCSGMRSCQDTSIITTDNVYCLGGWACLGSNKNNHNISNAKNIFCSSEYTCCGTTITSAGDLNVYLLGYKAGCQTDIYCMEGDTCFLLCGALDACDTTTIYCDGICNVECDGIDTKCPIMITNDPTTAIPTTAIPTTTIPSTSMPTTSVPTTAIPTTSRPTTAIPTTFMPTTYIPTTSMPTTNIPTTSTPITATPTTVYPTTYSPTTFIPTYIPTTAMPTTFIPTTGMPTTNPTNNGQAMESTTIEFTGTPIKNDDGFFFSLPMAYILIGIIAIVCIVVIICAIILYYRRKRFHNKDTMVRNMETEMTGTRVSSMSDVTHVSEQMEGPKRCSPTGNNINYATNHLIGKNDSSTGMYDNKQTPKGEDIENEDMYKVDNNITPNKATPNGDLDSEDSSVSDAMYDHKETKGGTNGVIESIQITKSNA
eukprot:463987_1